MNNVKLTIAIPSLPERMSKGLTRLYDKLQFQIGKQKDIEILSIIDNRIMSIGKKRTRLFSAASGAYTCIIDDDDDIVDDFVSTLRNAITDSTNVDVICYNQLATVHGKQWTIKTSLDHNKKHPFDQLEVNYLGNPVVCKRPPWHWCAWKTNFAKSIPFGDSNCHEDAIFVMQACELAKTQMIIDKTMCIYNESQTAFNPNLDINSIQKVMV